MIRLASPRISSPLPLASSPSTPPTQPHPPRRKQVTAFSARTDVEVSTFSAASIDNGMTSSSPFMTFRGIVRKILGIDSLTFEAMNHRVKVNFLLYQLDQIQTKWQAYQADQEQRRAEQGKRDSLVMLQKVMSKEKELDGYFTAGGSEDTSERAQSSGRQSKEPGEEQKIGEGNGISADNIGLAVDIGLSIDAGDADSAAVATADSDSNAAGAAAGSPAVAAAATPTPTKDETKEGGGDKDLKEREGDKDLKDKRGKSQRVMDTATEAKRLAMGLDGRKAKSAMSVLSTGLMRGNESKNSTSMEIGGSDRSRNFAREMRRASELSLASESSVEKGTR